MAKTTRTVKSVTKNLDGKITHLHGVGPYGTEWSASVEDVSRDVLDGKYAYCSKSEAGPEVVCYLRTKADSSKSNNLEALPEHRPRKR